MQKLSRDFVILFAMVLSVVFISTFFILVINGSMKLVFESIVFILFVLSGLLSIALYFYRTFRTCKSLSHVEEGLKSNIDGNLALNHRDRGALLRDFHRY